MKAERRHELRQNELATKIVQLPNYWNYWRQWAGRAALAVAIMLAVTALVFNRISSNRAAHAEAVDHLMLALQLVDQVRYSPPAADAPLDPKYLNYLQGRYEEVNSELDHVAAVTSDAKLLGQAAVARGDLNLALANIPQLPAPTTATTTSTSQPAPPAAATLKSREEYLSAAAAAYQEVADKYADQPLNAASAQFGLGAVAEDKGDWDAASGHYQAIILSNSVPETFKALAKQHIDRLPQMRHPALLERTPTTPLVVATTQASTAPAEPTTATTAGAAARPATTQATTAAATAPATNPK